MSNIPIEPTGPPDDAIAPALGATRTAYQTLADELIQGIDALSARVPRLEFAHEATEHFIRQHRWVNVAFIATAIASVERTPALRALDKFDLSDARDTLQFLEAFKPVLDRIRAFGDSVRFTMSARKSSVAADALQVYALAKGFARDPRSAVIGTVVQNLRRDLGTRGGRPEEAPQEPEAPNASGPRS